MADALRFFVDGVPVPKGRPRTGRTRRGGKVVIFTDERTKVYEEVVRLRARMAAKKQGWKADERPKRLALQFYLPIPTSWTKAERAAAAAGQRWPAGVPDLDNLVKAVKDGLNGVAWEDDSQVVDLDCVKRYALIPGVQVEVLDVEGA